MKNERLAEAVLPVGSGESIIEKSVGEVGGCSELVSSVASLLGLQMVSSQGEMKYI